MGKGTHTGTRESIWSEMIYFMYFLSLCAQGLIVFLGEGNGEPQNKQIKQCSPYVNAFEIVIQKIPDCNRLAASVVNRRQYLKRKAKDRQGEYRRRRKRMTVSALRNGDSVQRRRQVTINLGSRNHKMYMCWFQE